MERLLDDGYKEAEAALKLLDKPQEANAVIQVGITFISILIGASSSILMAPYLQPYLSSFIYWLCQINELL